MQHVDKLIERFVAGESDEAERFMVNEHLADCPACAAKVAAARRIWDLLGDVAEVAPPLSTSAWSGIRVRTLGRNGGSNLYGGGRWSRAAVATAALAAGLGLAILLPARQTDPTMLAVDSNDAWGSSFWYDEQAETAFGELWLAAEDEGSGS